MPSRSIRDSRTGGPTFLARPMMGAPNAIQGPLLGQGQAPVPATAGRVTMAPRMGLGPQPPRPPMPPAPMQGATGPGTVNPGVPGMMQAGAQPMGARLIR